MFADSNRHSLHLGTLAIMKAACDSVYPGLYVVTQAARGGGGPLAGACQEAAHALRARLPRDVVLLAPPDGGVP